MNLFVHADKPTEPTLEFSWEETTYSYSIQRKWTGDSIVVNHSGNYTDTYSTDSYEYNESLSIIVEGDHNIFHEANYSYVSNTTIIGNLTLDINFQIYNVDLSYGPNVRVIWIAFKQGELDMDYYLTSYIQNFSYYEENHQIINSNFKKFDVVTNDLLDTWNSSDEIFGEKDYIHTRNNTRYPYSLYEGINGEFSLPLILTIQLFKTEKKDRIAWANMFHDLIIYKDLDANSIFSVADKESMSEPPVLRSSNEMFGFLAPIAWNWHRKSVEYIDDSNDPGVNHSIHIIYPIDKSISEIASTIKFSAPTTTPDANVSWGIQYPAFPTYAHFDDSVNWFTSPMNSSYIHSCPTDYSYEFDYNIGENYTNLDITWELGKITNTSLYDLVQGYGITMPQYNYFLASFEIDEIDTKELTLPCDSFKFESNDTLVAEINMGGPNKKNYTLYDFPTSGMDTEFESRGGSVHPMVIAFDELSSHAGEPFVNSIFTLGEIVMQDSTFNIADSLFRLETQNYPVWSGERLRHDPTLTVYFEEYEVEEADGKKPFIPGYNYTLLIGTVGVITCVIVLERRKKRLNLN